MQVNYAVVHFNAAVDAEIAAWCIDEVKRRRAQGAYTSISAVLRYLANAGMGKYLGRHSGQMPRYASAYKRVCNVYVVGIRENTATRIDRMSQHMGVSRTEALYYVLHAGARRKGIYTAYGEIVDPMQSFTPDRLRALDEANSSLLVRAGSQLLTPKWSSADDRQAAYNATKMALRRKQGR